MTRSLARPYEPRCCPEAPGSNLQAPFVIHIPTMLAYVIPLSVLAILFGVFVYMSERHGLLRASDRFPSVVHRWSAYAWLGFFLLVLGGLTIAASQSPGRAEDLKSVPFYSL